MEQQQREIDLEDASLTEEAVERALRAKSFWLRFPPSLEARFERDTTPGRRLPLLISLMLAPVIYNLFGFVDPIAFPDIRGEAFFLRHIVYTLVSIGIAYGVYKATTPWAREMFLLLGGLWSVGVTVLLVMLSKNTLADQLLYGLMPMIMFGVLVLRQRFAYALAFGVGLMVMHTAAMMTVSSENNLPGAASGLVGVVVLFTLMAGYSIEKETRKNYLNALREEMRRHSLERLTLLDSLTGIGNRRALELRLGELEASGRLAGAAVIFADIDHFKAYNDSFGHAAGDQCLRRIADLLVAEARGENDFVFRFGGEEFVVLLPEQTEESAILVAERMRRAVVRAAIPHCWPTHAASVTVSFGVAMAPSGAEEDVRRLLEYADGALYQAKSDGRNCVRSATFVQSADPRESASAKGHLR